MPAAATVAVFVTVTVGAGLALALTVSVTVGPGSGVVVTVAVTVGPAFTLVWTGCCSSPLPGVATRRPARNRPEPPSQTRLRRRRGRVSGGRGAGGGGGAVYGLAMSSPQSDTDGATVRLREPGCEEKVNGVTVL